MGPGYNEFNNQGVNELANWVCSNGVYKDGKIIAKVPSLMGANYDDSQLQYNVDIALNGQ